jgi:hypothetical protein
MAGSARPQRRGNPDQLRSDIDSGRTGDKVAFRDPAAAPLGTDEEAAGTPVSARAAAIARKQETGGPHAPAQASGRGRRVGSAWIMVGLIVVLAAVMVGAAFLR